MNNDEKQQQPSRTDHDCSSLLFPSSSFRLDLKQSFLDDNNKNCSKRYELDNNDNNYETPLLERVIDKNLAVDKGMTIRENLDMHSSTTNTTASAAFADTNTAYTTTATTRRPAKKKQRKSYIYILSSDSEEDSSDFSLY